MYYCCYTVGKTETGLHAVQVMLLCTIEVTLWGRLRLGFTLSGNVAMYFCCNTVGKPETGLVVRKCCYILWL